MNDPLENAIPVGSGPGKTVQPQSQQENSPGSSPPPSTPSAVRTSPSGNDKIWAILSHLSAFVGLPFILPIVVYLAMKGDSLYVSSNAKEALNFHISLFIYTLCMVPLVWLLIGIPLMVVLGIGALILSIIAAFKAGDGEVYRYPLTLRLVS